jgi:hypothetical protein
MPDLANDFDKTSLRIPDDQRVADVTLNSGAITDAQSRVPRNSQSDKCGRQSEQNRRLDKKQYRANRQHNVLPQQTAAKNGAELGPPSASHLNDPMHIFKNERGELAITSAGSARATQIFLGSNASAGQDNTPLDNHRWTQVTCALPQSKGKCDEPLLLNIALDGVAALAPRDGMEVMLCSQLVALHSQGMEFLRRAMLADQTTSGVDSNVNRVAKTLRTFATMADCLRTYRGGGQQKVIVEHVTVQSGGQAIVGTVNRGTGGGDEQQNRE